ncbi:MAG: radical SAM protein [bacterium]|nr:radical SAM protein [bacterium]
MPQDNKKSTQTKTINILVSQPNHYADSNYLPYMWAILKTYCNNFSPRIRAAYNWLPPVYLNQPAPELLAEYAGETIHILCLSCYVWNSELNYEIARLVKEKNPQCLVIAGGPDNDSKDPEFLSRHPEVDIIVKQDGEIPLSKLLLKYLDNDTHYPDIPGLVFRRHNQTVDTGNCELPVDFSVSPYLAEKEYFSRIREKHRDLRAFWETNRGCPYGCVFCDWGSNTNSKVRKFPMERLFAELEWFSSQMAIDFFIINDANFGILPRDLDITDKLVELKKKTRSPNSVIYFAAKNNTLRTIEISKRLYKAGLIPHHTLGMQHTDDAVLDAMNRRAISLKKQIDAVKVLKQSGVPTLSQLIMGSPGDTLDKWKKTLTDVMELGCHEEYRTNLFNVLRGSRAHEKDYREQWQMGTIYRYTCGITRKKSSQLDYKSKSEYIVQSKTFSRDDWIQMYLYDMMVQEFHNGGITRFLAMYLRHTHGIPYSRFYHRLYDHLCRDETTFTGKLFKKCEDHLRRFVYAPYDDPAIEEMDVEDLPNSPNLYKPGEYVLFKFFTHFSQLWEELGAYIRKTYGEIQNIGSIIHYQREIIITVDYDMRKGKHISLTHDWVDYFKKAKTLTGEDPLPEPQPCNKKVKVKDIVCGAHTRFMLNCIYQQDNEKMLQKFMDAVIGVYYTRAERTYFRNLKTVET